MDVLRLLIDIDGREIRHSNGMVTTGRIVEQYKKRTKASRVNERYRCRLVIMLRSEVFNCVCVCVCVCVVVCQFVGLLCFALAVCGCFCLSLTSSGRRLLACLEVFLSLLLLLLLQATTVLT